MTIRTSRTGGARWAVILVVLVALGLMFYKRLAVSPFWRRRT